MIDPGYAAPEPGRPRAPAATVGANMFRMRTLVALLLTSLTLLCAADLPARKYLNLAAIKTMVAAAEAEAHKRNVQVTICIVDESGNLLFLQ